MNKKRLIQIITLIGAVISLILAIYAFKMNLFNDPKQLQAKMNELGSFGIIVFLIIQILQPIVPFIPGGMSDVAGIMMYGPFWGMVYVCFGLIIGEYLAFLMVRTYGMRFLTIILNEKSITKIKQWLHQWNDKMLWLLAIIFIMPFGPDDLACYACGLSEVSSKKYLLTITLLKPISVGIHVFISLYILQKIS